jgi:hypothetical protein
VWGGGALHLERRGEERALGALHAANATKQMANDIQSQGKRFGSGSKWHPQEGPTGAPR